MVESGLNSKQYLASQYRDASNLNSRVQLHDRFSTNHYGLQLWIFDHFNLPSQCNILELGCGPGSLWRENLDRIPEKWEITITDFSEGMLFQARQNLSGNQHLDFQKVDAGTPPLPFRDASFDAVIANHMLYHISERDGLFSEIFRVLKPNGHLYASTVGQRHLLEIGDLIREFDPGLASWVKVTDSFRLENGADQLSQFFSNINIFHYEDALEVNEYRPLAEYILSGWIDLDSVRLKLFKNFIKQKMEAHGGCLHITKDTGLFTAIKKQG